MKNYPESTSPAEGEVALVVRGLTKITSGMLVVPNLVTLHGEEGLPTLVAVGLYSDCNLGEDLMSVFIVITLQPKRLLL